ncbi:NUDIX domain-containing protein [Nocardia seriolae]|uniref:ADP-ribose diphosphatase n=1 Tax=Nocardia seriolae TaxID=37332 RepID=A0A0B8NGN2_9NOCA|nr:NUDIX hydrolase [Nocardia seriolae]APA99711.1 ADP-ribose diphosphatase [Nocardia seriolae]MTJ64277.1 NUDIX domain-containing protein [Nocardia seriolae]MTJ72879.1 NUDIX domain-containing protein [Nocardia seriolae]MTJ89268.1 NUDIX domain-containing protein [Nocardia seriolae]MTK33246.1 NUDIX domain-containing protein [Nocardia seriolae]
MTSSGSVPGAHDFDVLSSRTVYSGAILALRLDRVVMPGGKVAEREVIEHHGAVAVAALDENDNLVLINQYRHPIGRRLLELPAGLLDEQGEDPVEAAKRELAEETGLAAREWSVLVDVALSPGFTDEALRVYLATGLYETDRPDPEGEEADLQILRMPLGDAVRAALAGEITNATAVAGVTALMTARSTGATLRPADAPWPGMPTAFLDRKAREKSAPQ